MTNHSQLSLAVLLFLLLIAATNSSPTYDELDATLQALRNHGYTLFTNAITTSDIQFQLLNNFTGDSTIFAPKDPAIFALDMASDAGSYISALRYHVIPNRRLTFSDLQNLSSPFLETLLPHYNVLIGKTIDARLVSTTDLRTGVMVDGVILSDPDLFIGSGIVVHGIDGVLVTGLNTYHSDLENGSGVDVASPAESPQQEEGTLSPPMSVFDLNTPTMSPASQSPASQSHGNTPVGAPFQNVKGLGKKKRHLRHKRRRDHRIDDL